MLILWPNSSDKINLPYMPICYQKFGEKRDVESNTKNKIIQLLSLQYGINLRFDQRISRINSLLLKYNSKNWIIIHLFIFNSGIYLAWWNSLLHKVCSTTFCIETIKSDESGKWITFSYIVSISTFYFPSNLWYEIRNVLAAYI